VNFRDGQNFSRCRSVFQASTHTPPAPSRVHQVGYIVVATY